MTGDCAIRVLIVDDDYHVAGLHSRAVARIPGFTTVGEAHTAAHARSLVSTERPDLLLLDMYLPDQNGLDLIRSLTAEATAGADAGAKPAPGAPDFILVTAARDIDSVRTAMQLGAVYYLVKPFAFAALREQLEAYRQWRQRMTGAREADQETVDSLYSLLRSPATTAHSRHGLPPTMVRVLEAVAGAPAPVGASEVAELLGVSRPTAQRYLASLLRRELINLDLAYGSTGRPEHRYSARRGH